MFRLIGGLALLLVFSVVIYQLTTGRMLSGGFVGPSLVHDAVATSFPSGVATSVPMPSLGDVSPTSLPDVAATHPAAPFLP